MTQHIGKFESAAADRRLPLHVRVKDDITRRIQDNEWPAGTALPPEAHLAEYYEISVGTLRRVTAELSAEGLLERQQGRGTYVRRASFQHSLFRFFRIKGREGKTPTGRILERRIEAAGKEVASALGVELEADVLHLRRLRLWDEDPFLLEAIWLPMPLFRPMLSGAPEDLGDLLYPEYEARVGVVIGSATEELSITTANADQISALRCENGTPLVRIRRTARTHAGDVVEFRESFGLAESFQYRVEIN